MLGLPRSTEVDKDLKLNKLCANAALPAQMRDLIKDQIESIFWRNKLADSTIGVAAGDTVKEIQVFEVALKQRGLDKRILPAIAKAIPYKLLFMLIFGDEVQASMEAEGAFYSTRWDKLDDFALKFEGLNIDAVYENLVRQIADGRLAAEGDLAEAVDIDKRRQKLEHEIAALEKKVTREKQFNRQVELNGELKRLRSELESVL